MNWNCNNTVIVERERLPESEVDGNPSWCLVLHAWEGKSKTVYSKYLLRSSSTVLAFNLTTGTITNSIIVVKKKTNSIIIIYIKELKKSIKI